MARWTNSTAYAGAVVVVAWLAVGDRGFAQSERSVLEPGEVPWASETLRASRGGVPAEAIPDTYRSRIRRSVGEAPPTPDVLELKSGRELEVYFLQAFGPRLVYYLKEDERTFARHEVSRSAVRAVRHGEFLPRDPSEPVAIRVAEKQPVPKHSPLAGTFQGWQDRHTRWTVTFYSESHKPASWSEDATDFGTFLLTSRRQVGSYQGKTRTTGTYLLYAPRTVRNADWVIALVDMGHGENDLTDHPSWNASSLPDDLLVVRFSADKRRFRLLWSNLSAGSFSALPQVEFRRASAAPASAPEARPATLPLHSPERARKPDTLRPARGAVQVRAPRPQPPRDWVAAVNESPEEATLAALRHRRTVFAVDRLNIGHRTDGWLRPTGYWVR